MESIEKIAEESRIDLGDAKIDAEYRFPHSCLYEVLEAIATNPQDSPHERPVISMRSRAIAISGRFTREHIMTVRPIAMIVSGEQLGEDGSYGYVVTIQQNDTRGYQGPDIVDRIRKYIV